MASHSVYGARVDATGSPSFTLTEGANITLTKVGTDITIAGPGASGVTDGDKGDVTVSSSGTVWTIDAGAVTAAKTSITGTPDGSKYLRDDWSWQAVSGGVSDGDKGDITVSASGTTWTIDSAAVTLAKMANLAQDQFIVRTTASTGVPETATCTAFARTILDDADAAAVRTTIGAGTGDGTVTSVSGSAPIASSGGATPAISLNDGGVSLAKMADLAQDTLIGRQTASTGVPEAITCTAAGRALLDDAAASNQRTTLGLGTIATVDDAPSDGSTYGRNNGAWAVAGGGSGLTHPQVMARGVFGGPF